MRGALLGHERSSEWTDMSWNRAARCAKVSLGCDMHLFKAAIPRWIETSSSWRGSVMGVKPSYPKKIEYLAKPFVESGIFDSPEKFVGELAHEMAERKIKHYARVVKRFEAKYRTSFPKFSEKLKSKATPKLEDDWMEWEAAINMLHAWKKASEELGLSAS